MGLHTSFDCWRDLISYDVGTVERYENSPYLRGGDVPGEIGLHDAAGIFDVRTGRATIATTMCDGVWKILREDDRMIRCERVSRPFFEHDGSNRPCRL